MLARYMYLHVCNFCMYMLNCCSLFFFFRYLYKGILYIFSAFTVRICDLGFFDLDSFFLFHIFIFLLDCAFASSYEECTVPSVGM